MKHLKTIFEANLLQPETNRLKSWILVCTRARPYAMKRRRATIPTIRR